MEKRFSAVSHAKTDMGQTWPVGSSSAHPDVGQIIYFTDNITEVQTEQLPNRSKPMCLDFKPNKLRLNHSD